MRIVDATLCDIPDMQKLLAPFVMDGIILPRSDAEIASHIYSYVLAKEDDHVVGMGSLHIHTATLGEVRSLAVSKAYQNKGVGAAIVTTLVEKGNTIGLKDILTLTYKKEFFERLGFKEVEKTEIPEQKVWADCIKCKHFPNCDEISLIKSI